MSSPHSHIRVGHAATAQSRQPQHQDAGRPSRKTQRKEAASSKDTRAAQKASASSRSSNQKSPPAATESSPLVGKAGNESVARFNLPPGLNLQVPQGYLVISNTTKPAVGEPPDQVGMTLEQAQRLRPDWQERLGGVYTVYPVDNNATAQEPINPNLLPGHAAQFLNPNLPGGYLVITNGTNALLENRKSSRIPVVTGGSE